LADNLRVIKITRVQTRIDGKEKIIFVRLNPAQGQTAEITMTGFEVRWFLSSDVSHLKAGGGGGGGDRPCAYNVTLRRIPVINHCCRGKAIKQ
jgi:hypothetical protein